jgi:hypothetical protein
MSVPASTLMNSTLNCNHGRRLRVRRWRWQARKLPLPVRLKYILALLLLFGPSASAQLQNEYAVRAAFVLNLTKYVEWPQASNALTVCSIGDGPIGETLKQMLAGKNNESRPIQVLLFPSDEALERCDIIYIAHSSSKKIREALDRVGNRSILTVGDTDSFTREGGMVGLVRVGEQMQIQINMDAIQAARLKVSARLLNLSSVVRITGKH